MDEVSLFAPSWILIFLPMSVAYISASTCLRQCRIPSWMSSIPWTLLVRNGRGPPGKNKNQQTKISNAEHFES
jgi:hypothetical protein